MVVPTGTATPWEEMPYAQVDSPDTVVYLRDGWVTGSADLLAEALRADGVIRTLSAAIRAAESAVLETRWYGYVDESFDPVLCDASGETETWERVDTPRECVIATVRTGE